MAVIKDRYIKTGHKQDMWFVVERRLYSSEKRPDVEITKRYEDILSIHYHRSKAERRLNGK